MAKFKTPEDATKAVRFAYLAAYAVAGIQFAVVVMFIPAAWPGLLIDVPLIAGLGFALQERQSRTAAVVMFAYAVLTAGGTLMARIGAPIDGVGSGKNIGLALVLLGAAIYALQGTFGYHRLIGSRVLPRRVIRVVAVTAGYAGGLAAAAIFGAAMLVPAVFEPAYEHFLGTMLIVPVLLAAFLGGFGLLPGARGLPTMVVAADEDG